MMKKKMSKFTRILIASLVSVIALGTACWGVTKLVASDTYEPIVWRFNNWNDYSKLNAYKTTAEFYDGEDGKKAFSLQAQDAYDSYFYIPSTELSGIDFSQYKYIVYSAKCVKKGKESATIFMQKDNSWSYFEFQVPTDKGWASTVVDLESKSTATYTLGGETIFGGFYSSEYVGNWSGSLTSLRLDYNRYKTEGTTYLEYIGLFHTKDEAIAYAKAEVGAMPNDEAANAISTTLKEGFTLPYSQAATEDLAREYATKKVTECVEEYFTENEEITHDIQVKGISDYKIDGTGGSFKARVWIYLGEALKRNLIDETITFKVNAKPDPVSVVYDSESKVNGASFWAADTDDYELKFVEDESLASGGYLELSGSSTSEFNPMYNNYLSQAGVSSTFSCDDYPYMKMLYKRNVSDAITSEKTQVYMFDANGRNGSWSFDLYTVSSGEEPYWEAMVTDMRSCEVTFYDTEGNVKSTATSGRDTTGLAWEGTPNSLRFDLTKLGKAERTMSVAYIAFFATEAEAIAYPNSIQGAFDAAMLENNASFEVGNYVTTKELADAEAKAYVDSFNFTTDYAISNGSLTKPSTTSEGTYTFDVTFSDSNGSYDVSCTMTIAKTETPIVYTLDTGDVVNKFQATANLNKSLEKGYLKMTSPNPAAEDGFYLETATSTLGEEFDLTGRRFAKVRYQLSGVEDKASSTKMQFYTVVDGKYYNKTSFVLSEEDIGDIVELIVDFSASGTAEAVWLKNVTDGGDYQVKTLSNPDDTTPLGTVTRIRFNPARIANADRTSYVEYIGFFSSLEEAKSYDGIANERLDEAEQSIREKLVKLEWGEGNTEEKALAKFDAMIQSDIGCTLKDIVYKAPTDKEEGKITFTAVLYSGGVEREVTDLQVVIGKAPDPVIWRFNEESALDDIVFQMNTEASIENNVLKLVNTYSGDAEGFGFTLNTDSETQFYLQNNPYIVVKYRRDGVGPVTIKYTTDLNKNTTFYANNGNLGFGPESGTWYTTVVDTGVKNYESPLVRNYSHDENVDDFNFYIPYKVPLSNSDIYKFQGLSQSFTFSLANFRDVERTCYIEYLGFFPTLDAALNYDEEYESVTSDTEVALKDYTGETVSYYDGDSEETAKKTAKRLIDERLLDDVHSIKKLNDVDITITTKEYNAPQKDSSDGEYIFSATLTYNNIEICKVDECTLTISQKAEEQVYLFTNPDFVATIDGAIASDNYDYMQLNGGFTLDVSDRNISLANYPRISLGLTEAKGAVTMTVNGTTLTLCEDESIMNAELSVVLTAEGYKVYKDADEQPIQSGTISEDILNDPLEYISFGFGEEGAKVRYLVFFAEESVSKVFDYTLPDELKNIADITDSSCHAGDASTSAKAVERAKKLALNSAGDGVSAVKMTLDDYHAATTTETGTYTCTVLLAYGETQATYYEEVEVKGEMSVQPSNPIWLNMSEESVSNIYQQNLTMSLVDGCIHTETISANTEDAFFEFPKSCLSESTLYLPDYPYISIQFKRTGVIDGDTGETQIYFWTDENPDPSKNHPSLECSFGAEDLLNEWVTAIIDTNTMMVTLYDMNDEKVYSTATFDGSMGQYIGNLDRMRLTMARNIKTDRTADIKYFGFFSTLEAAEEYMDGMYINHYMQFAGNECAILNQVINTEAMTVELAARIDSTMKGTKMPLISNKCVETESYFALEINEDGQVQLTCGSNVIATTEEDICTGKWTYVTASVDKDSAKIYLNGELKAEGKTGINTDAITSGVLVVGGDYVDESKKLVGDLANIKFYSALKEPTGYEIPGTMTDDMIAGWALDAITTERNFVGYETSDYILTLHDQLSRQGHEFVGSDCLITEDAIASAPQTVEGWMKVPRTQLNGTYTLIATSGMRVQLVDGQIVAFYNDSEVLRTAELQIIPGMWTHIAVTFDAVDNEVNIYVNGELKKTGDATINIGNDSLGKVYIGATEEKTAMFKGMLSDVTLWSTVRDTIASDMTEAISTTDEGLLGAWDLCTHDILDYVDASLQNNTATLTSDTWYKLEGRETPAYTIVQVSDTQNTTGFSGEVKHQAMFDWIAANVNNMNMVYLTHGGDVTQINTESQWQEARKAFDKIEDCLLPYGIALGNHDYATPSHGIGAELRDDRLFNKYFPYADYAENHWFGGAFEEGSRSNIYNLIEVDVDKDGDADEEYIFFSLEFGPRDEVVDWVCKTLEEHAERKAIITTHSYLENDGSYSIKNVTAYGSYDFKDANEGFDLWNKIAYEYPNVIMITCGHTQGNSSAQEVNQNKLGNNVVQILADPSAYGGFPSVESLIFMMTFDKDGNMNTYYYSADRDMYYGTVNEYEYSADDYFKIPTSESE